MTTTRTRAPAWAPELLLPSQAAALFGVDPRTVVRWAKTGKLTAIRTVGGRHRFRADEVRALLSELRPAGEASCSHDDVLPVGSLLRAAPTTWETEGSTSNYDYPDGAATVVVGECRCRLPMYRLEVTTAAGTMRTGWAAQEGAVPVGAVPAGAAQEVGR